MPHERSHPHYRNLGNEDLETTERALRRELAQLVHKHQGIFRKYRRLNDLLAEISCEQDRRTNE